MKVPGKTEKYTLYILINSPPFLLNSCGLSIKSAYYTLTSIKFSTMKEQGQQFSL